jgi:hypothetical protein
MLDRGACRNGRRHHLTRVSRLLAGAAAVVLLMSTAVSCSPALNGPSPTLGSGVSASPAAIRTQHVISIPTGEQDAFARCMLDLGWQITAVYTPSASGEASHYQFTHPNGVDPELLREQTQQCQALEPSPVPFTDDEIRQIYNRWVGEYKCLVSLGYQPDPPPSVETFVASWKTGPWMPIQGIATQGWGQAQYDEAKAKCTLDMFSDDRFSQ